MVFTMTTSPRLKVGILFGGRSAEHEISIRSARNIVAHAVRRGRRGYG